MKKILSMVIAMAVLMLSVLIPVSAETTVTPSAENTKFLYDKIVLDNSKETNYSIVNKEAGDVAFDYKEDPIVKNGEFNGLTDWTSAYCPTDGNVAALHQNYHLKQTVTLEKNTDYEFEFDIDNEAVAWLVLKLKGADNTELISKSTSDFGKTGWKTYTFSFNSGENESVTIDFCSTSANKVILVDNISIKKVSYIKNGSFENGFADWGNGGNTVVNTYSSNGLKTLYLNSQHVKTYQLVNVSKNTKYQLTYDVYNPDGKYANACVFDSTRTTTINNTSIQAYGRNAWETVYITFDSGDYESLRIEFQLSSSAAGVYIDNVKLEKAPIVKNGSFEKNYNEWSYGSNTIDSTKASDGKKSASLVQNYHLKQTVSLVKNANYEIKFDIDNSAVNSDSKHGWLVLNVTGADGTKFVSQSTDSYGKNGWTSYTFSFNSGENEAATIDFCNTRTAAMKIDNISIVMLPMIKNGGFENNYNDWGYGTNTISSTNASKGTKSAYLAYTDVKVYQNVTVSKNTYYQISFDVYNPDGKWANATVWDSERANKISDTQVNPYGKSGWETITKTFNSGDRDTLRIEFILGSAAAGVYIDNVKLEQLETIVSYEAIGDNIISIESGKDYNYTIAWEYADGSASGEFPISGKARELGDANNDSFVDVRDLVNMKKGFANNSKDLVYDLSLEGSVNSLDLTIIRQILLGVYSAPEVVYASDNGILPNTGNDVSSDLQNLLQKKITQ